MYKIMIINEENNSVTIGVDGRIVDQCMTSLEQLVNNCLSKKFSVTLDFTGVNYISELSVDKIRQFIDKGIKIINCSLYVEALIYVESLINGEKESQRGTG